MSLQLNSPPAAEPVTLDQAKAWLRVESGGDEDALIAALIAAARARAEWHTGRAFVTQVWTLWLDRVEACIAIPLPPLQMVESVTLYKHDDSALVLNDGDYIVDAAGSRVLLQMPPPGLRPINAAAIAFTAGYGDAGDGYYVGVGPQLDQAGLSKTILPMNINPNFWSDLGTRAQLNEPLNNIVAGAKILKGITENLNSPSVEAVATLYNALSATKVSDYGARAGAIYRSRPWLK
jgi:uncharacterized phiE125 gp8 family phage protein